RDAATRSPSASPVYAARHVTLEGHPKTPALVSDIRPRPGARALGLVRAGAAVPRSPAVERTPFPETERTDHAAHAAPAARGRRRRVGRDGARLPIRRNAGAGRSRDR